MEPIIGITADSTFVSDGAYPEPYKVNYSPRNISKAVTLAGGIPVVIPVNEPGITRKYAGIIDGLILAGGDDISPHLYDEDPRVTIKATYPKRDAAEIALAQEMMAKRKPILGICRGLQLLNVVFGGSLYQDLSEDEEIYVKHIQETASNHPIHSVKVDSASYMGSFLSSELTVNSFHHQVIRQLGEGLRVAATSSDGVIEAVEAIEEEVNVLAIQWHPENLYYKDADQMAIFENLIERAKSFDYELSQLSLNHILK